MILILFIIYVVIYLLTYVVVYIYKCIGNIVLQSHANKAYLNLKI